MSVHNPVTISGADSSGNSAPIESTGGAAHVVGQELGIETFEASHTVNVVLSIVTATYTVPAGCSTVEINPIKITDASFVAFAGTVALRVNTTFTTVNGTQQVIKQTDFSPFRIQVNPGDVIYFRGTTGVAGQLSFTALG